MDLGIEGIGDASEIAAGASAIVYRATQESLGREVAVKVLSVRDDDFVRRFRREARLLAKLSQSPRIVTIHDTGVTRAGQPFLVLQLCDRSLLDEIKSRGTIEPLEAAGIASRVAAAVDDAHELDIVHRDLKPANVLMTGTDLLVSDFGTSVISGASTGVTSSISYTAGYVAPETLMGSTPGKPVDVYAIGATLFHMVFGSPPFIPENEVANILALVHRVANEPVRDLRPEGVPDDLCRIIEAAMAKDPLSRPTISQLRASLDSFTSGSGHHRTADETVVAPLPLPGQPGPAPHPTAPPATHVAGGAFEPPASDLRGLTGPPIASGPPEEPVPPPDERNLPTVGQSTAGEIHHTSGFSAGSGSGGRSNRTRWWAATAAVVAIAAGGLGLWMFSSGSGDTSDPPADGTEEEAATEAAAPGEEATADEADQAEADQANDVADEPTTGPAGDLEEAERLLADGQPEEASAIAEAVLQVEPENSQALAVLGEARLLLGATDDAVRVLTEASVLDPGNPRISDSLGTAILETAPREVALLDRVETGTWPWEMTITDQALWVPLSGDRELARFNPADLSDTTRISVARLPLEFDTFGGDDVWSLVATDRQIVRVDQTTNATEVVATLPDCPEAMEAGPPGQIYVLLWQDCSSSDATMVRLSTDTGQIEESSLLGIRDAFHMEYGQELLWISGHNGLAAVDPETMTVAGGALDGEFLGTMTVDDRYVYVISFTGDTSIIYRVDQTSFQVEELGVVGGLVEFLVPYERLLISVNGQGEMGFTARDVPGFTSTIDLGLGEIGTSFGVVDGDRIFIDSGGAGFEREPGFLTVFDLRPGG